MKRKVGDDPEVGEWGGRIVKILLICRPGRWRKCNRREGGRVK